MDEDAGLTLTTSPTPDSWLTIIQAINVLTCAQTAPTTTDYPHD